MKQITSISFKEKGEKGVSISYKTFGENGFLGTTSKDWKGQPAASFVSAMEGFKFHLLFLCEIMDQDKFSKMPVDGYVDYRVCGVHVNGAEDKLGIMITGYKTLSNGKGFAFNSPNTKFSEEGYTFMNELQEAWKVLQMECDDYMKGKYAVVQLELEVTSPDSLPEASGSAGVF